MATLDGCADHDAQYFAVNDTDRIDYSANLYGTDRTGDEEVTEVLPFTAGISGTINGQVEEVYGGHMVIKAFNREEATIGRV